jgi:DNA-binding HxlR family transcriptional regulator
MEADGIVVRSVYPQIPSRVEYSLTECGQTLCPALDGIPTTARPPTGRWRRQNAVKMTPECRFFLDAT